MELGKHEKEIPAKETLKEKLTLHATYGQRTEERDLHVASPLKFLNTEQVPSGESGSKPLTFTFVPYIGQLPSHFEVVDASKFLVKISEKPNADTRQEIINKSHIPSGDLAFKNQFQQDSKSTFHPESTQKIFQPQEHNTGKRKMQENDLFKAEFIFITDSGEEDEETIARNKVQPPSVGSYGHTIFQSSNTSLDPTASNKPFSDMNAPRSQGAALSHSSTAQQYKIKTSYKAFAAIPTNTLLMEQKALEEPTKKASETELTTLDTHSEMCSPAQLRQQTEELCATIDQVLQDPLPMRRCESSPSFLQTPMDSDTGKMSTVPQRTAGRETKYANLYLSAPGMTESQLTKPGVIRPAPVKTKILLKKEEPYQPNPFKKYLEESRDPDVEQDTAPRHLLYLTKPIPPTQSSLHPQSISHADSLTPGPFSHLSCILCDVPENSYSPYSHNSLYNKPSHPIVPIPENEALSSKELHSATAQNKSNLLPTHESKETSKGKFPEPENTLYSERFIPAEEQKDTALKST
ncbi:PREDICTED: muscular LMNA-interacting protein isoform X3 [Crocodylus porosus]|uniref:muscular LMNA-interacting protein isoform X3 n=1 Tax=Crocodylus porosus TaxID=8502 RepID=UPI000939E590|nr:PREDICTED: muscular LMNA-interacting protein isoform X3 [Crocodylus porosus]